MKSNLYIQNLRCGGCATSISKALSIIHGINDVEVIPEEDKVTFTSKNDSTRLEAALVLKKLGYPVAEAENSMKHKAQSLISCVKGKLS